MNDLFIWIAVPVVWFALNPLWARWTFRLHERTWDPSYSHEIDAEEAAKWALLVGPIAFGLTHFAAWRTRRKDKSSAIWQWITHTQRTEEDGPTKLQLWRARRSANSWRKRKAS